MVLISGQLRAHLGSNPLAATSSGSPLLGPPSLSPLLGDLRSAMLLTAARAAAQPSMTTAFLPPPATVMTPGLSSPAIATSMSAGLPPTVTSSPIISAVPPLLAVALNPLLSLRVSGKLHHRSVGLWYHGVLCCDWLHCMLVGGGGRCHASTLRGVCCSRPGGCSLQLACCFICWLISCSTPLVVVLTFWAGSSPSGISISSSLPYLSLCCSDFLASATGWPTAGCSSSSSASY